MDELIQKAKAGCSVCKQEIINTLMPMIQSRAYARRSLRFEVEDLIQIGVLGALEGIERFDSSRLEKITVRTFFYDCVEFAILNHIRLVGGLIRVPRNQKGPKVCSVEDTGDVEDSGDVEVLDLDSLNPREQYVIKSYIAGIHVKEIALVIGVGEERVRQIRKEAIKKMKGVNDEETKSKKRRHY